jgi:hypothetical protein
MSHQSDIFDNTITITGSGAGLTPATGIRSNETGGGGSLQSGWSISANQVTLNNGGRGILYRNGWLGSLKGNIVNNLLQTNPYDGILSEGVAFSEVNANTIGQSASGDFGISHAIRSSSGWTNAYECNCVDNTSIGMQFYDLADYTDRVSANRFNTHSIGLRLGDDNIGSTYVGTQTHRGNLWNEEGQGGVNHGGTQSVVLRSLFTVDAAENSDFNTIVDPEYWFKDVTDTEQSYSCANACDFLVPITPPIVVTEGSTPTGLDLSIAAGQFPTDAYATEMTWKANYRLYRRMLRQPALQTYNATFSAFKTVQENTSVGKLAWVSEERSKLYHLSGQQQNNLDGYVSTLNQKRAAIAVMDAQRQAGQSVDGQQYATLQQEEATTIANIKSVHDAADATRQTQVQNLLAYNASISTAVTPANNHKTVNAILLNYASTGQFAANDLVTLDGIAAQCPLEGGDAVYEARSVVAAQNGTEYDDAAVCNSGNRPAQGREQLVKKDLKENVVYPNPTTGEIAWLSEGEAKVRVWNALGALVLEQSVTNQKLNLVGLVNGQYRVQIVIEGDASSIQTVVLQKN